MNGYAGKILRVDLTNGRITTIETERYEQWIGGHGIGSAIFFDIVVRERQIDLATLDGFDPENVITLMTSPLCGTGVPAASGRTELQGIGVQSYPIGWFTRSNFGGRFALMLKLAGWDGIVLEGAASTPVWLDIRNGDIQLRECAALGLWGMDTRACQQAIFEYVAGGESYGDWIAPFNGSERTTQRPAVLTIGPAGENLSRLGALIHDASNAAGQGGFGGVWGAKKLKAISVIGSGGIGVADPRELIRARLWQKTNYQFQLGKSVNMVATTEHHAAPVPEMLGVRPTGGQRPQACVGCHAGCRGRYEDGTASEINCYTAYSYPRARTGAIRRRAGDLCNLYGINACELLWGGTYLQALHGLGVLGPGRDIPCPLDFGRLGEIEWVEQLIKAISYRDDGLGNPDSFGDSVAEGFVRAAGAWGRLEEDLASGLLSYPHWGISVHRDPRCQLEWGYGTILSDRDTNEHCFDAQLHWYPTYLIPAGAPLPLTAAQAVAKHVEKMVPQAQDYENDQDRMRMLDYSSTNMYSEHIARMVAWHRHYTRFFKQSALFCDWRWPDFINFNAPDATGSTGEAEPKFLNAVTGKQLSFLDGMELGRKIWNLDHAIWTLQGRHRDMVHFAAYIYTRPVGESPHYLPGLVDGEWKFIDIAQTGRTIDPERFEEFKTRFYRLEGWNPDNGYPTRATLESLGLATVADELARANKLG